MLPPRVGDAGLFRGRVLTMNRNAQSLAATALGVLLLRFATLTHADARSRCPRYQSSLPGSPLNGPTNSGVI